jgi:hypothetical protein
MKVITRTIWAAVTALVVASLVGAWAASRRRQPGGDDPEADEIHLLAAVEPLGFTSRAAAFRGGTVEAWYGGGLIDLREATLDPAGARLTIRTVFGGFEIVVPESWRVVSEVRGIGGLGDGRPHIERPDDAPTLTIDGIAIFGGIGITATVTEDEVTAIAEAIERRERGRQRMDAFVERARVRAANRRARRAAHHGGQAEEHGLVACTLDRPESRLPGVALRAAVQHRRRGDRARRRDRGLTRARLDP